MKVKLLPVIITSACFRDETTAYVAKVQAKSNNNCDPLRENHANVKPGVGAIVRSYRARDA